MTKQNFNWNRYHDLVFQAICGDLTLEERNELDTMKETLEEMAKNHEERDG